MRTVSLSTATEKLKALGCAIKHSLKSEAHYARLPGGGSIRIADHDELRYLEVTLTNVEIETVLRDCCGICSAAIPITNVERAIEVAKQLHTDQF